MPRKSKIDTDEKISVHPFTVEEILAGLLAINPDDMPESEAEPKQPKSK